MNMNTTNVNTTYPITNTGVPAKKSQPNQSTTLAAKQKEKSVQTWWIVLSLIIIVVLSAGLIVAVYFNFNEKIVQEANCRQCCSEIPVSNNYLECVSENRTVCRGFQADETVSCNVDDTNLISGPFVLLSLNQIIQGPPNTFSTTNNISALSVSQSAVSSIQALSLKEYYATNENNLSSTTTMNIDIFGSGNITQESNPNMVLSIVNESIDITYDSTTYSFFGLTFTDRRDVAANASVAKVVFVNNQMVLMPTQPILGYSNFYLTAVSSADVVFGTYLFTTNSATVGAVFCTPTQAEFKIDNQTINPVRALYTWTPYYLFQSSN